MGRNQHSRTSSGCDRGITVVVFAVSVTAMLAVASLVLGGSTGYTAVRSAQNAADAASLAATTTLREVQKGTAFPAEVLATAQDVAQDNGADVGAVQCDVVTAMYAVAQADAEVIGPCDGTNELDPAAGGVRVRVAETRDVPFGAFVKSETITASAVASATVQPLRGGFRAPFMVCALASDHGIELLVPKTSTDHENDPPWEINPDAYGIELLLWSNGNGFGNRNCGHESWHGLVNTDQLYRIPSDPNDKDSWWDIDTGSRVGHIPRLLAGDDPCEWDEDEDSTTSDLTDIDSAEGCHLAVPLCVDTDGSGTNVSLYCVRLATFEITYVGHGEDDGSCASINKKVVCGVLQPGGIASGGQGTLEPTDPSEVVLIKLVQ